MPATTMTDAEFRALGWDSRSAGLAAVARYEATERADKAAFFAALYERNARHAADMEKQRAAAREEFARREAFRAATVPGLIAAATSAEALGAAYAGAGIVPRREELAGTPFEFRAVVLALMATLRQRREAVA